MQVDEKMIPEEAVEAAAEAIYEHWQFETPQGHRHWTPHGNSLSQDRARDFARAAIAAALASWPGVDYRPGAKVTKTWRDPGKIILPLPKESSDD